MVRVSVEAMNKDNVDKPFTSRCMYLGEPIRIDGLLWDTRGSLGGINIIDLSNGKDHLPSYDQTLKHVTQLHSSLVTKFGVDSRRGCVKRPLISLLLCYLWTFNGGSWCDLMLQSRALILFAGFGADFAVNSG